MQTRYFDNALYKFTLYLILTYILTYHRQNQPHKAFTPYTFNVVFYCSHFRLSFTGSYCSVDTRTI